MSTFVQLAMRASDEYDINLLVKATEEGQISWQRDAQEHWGQGYTAKWSSSHGAREAKVWEGRRPTNEEAGAVHVFSMQEDEVLRPEFQTQDLELVRRLQKAIVALLTKQEQDAKLQAACKRLGLKF